ncbi:MAG: ATP-dependent helicase, partial [Caldilineae bacterium]
GLDPDDSLATAGTINVIFNESSQAKHRAVANCMSAFNRFSEELIDPAKAIRQLPGKAKELARLLLEQEDVALLLNLYAAYQQSLRRDGTPPLTDFALLQKEAYQVLTQFPGAGQVFKHVIVDEYQDTNTIQERIFFKLAEGTGNICVVGDDDQALYRFRGATVENFVEFPARCQKYLGQMPHRISLDINYRSRQSIVEFYKDFIQQVDWQKPDGDGAYRVQDKNIQAHRVDPHSAVLASTPGKPKDVCAEIASFVRRLIDEGKVENPNQIAFLFPSLKSKQVGRMKEALEAEGLQVYAPRAGRFLEVDEAKDVFGLFLHIFGRPAFRGRGRDVEDFRGWLNSIEARGETLIQRDPQLKQFVADRQAELNRALRDYQALQKVVAHHHWDLSTAYDIPAMKRPLSEAPGLSETGRRLITSRYLDRVVERRARQGNPFSLNYIIRRATSLDWNVLDLFYQLMGFAHFKHMFDQAEHNGDEGPVANLGLITQYLQRFIDERVSIITANLLEDSKFQGIFFNSYLFALYRLGETELENREDPFPKGRIPFLTIHQSKGLEFPVVVLGNPSKRNRGPTPMEKIVRPLLERDPGEPLERITDFDIMRMFYVALSRAKNLLIIA